MRKVIWDGDFGQVGELLLWLLLGGGKSGPISPTRPGLGPRLGENIKHSQLRFVLLLWLGNRVRQKGGWLRLRKAPNLVLSIGVKFENIAIGDCFVGFDCFFEPELLQQPDRRLVVYMYERFNSF